MNNGSVVTIIDAYRNYTPVFLGSSDPEVCKDSGAVSFLKRSIIPPFHSELQGLRLYFLYGCVITAYLCISPTTLMTDEL